jgi:hypothetical protein
VLVVELLDHLLHERTVTAGESVPVGEGDIGAGVLTGEFFARRWAGATGSTGAQRERGSGAYGHHCGYPLAKVHS